MFLVSAAVIKPSSVSSSKKLSVIIFLSESILKIPPYQKHLKQLLLVPYNT